MGEPIDVTMVAVRRPELLAQVLASYRTNLLDRIPVGRVFLNIDPLWGDADADAAVERCVRSHFPDASIEITRPLVPSLTAAVKALWAKPQTDWFLHLEDDWALNIPVNPRRLRRQMRDPRVGQIRFSYWYPAKRFTRPVEFGTMPAFNRSVFARQVAFFMRPSLHPERQMYDGSNPPLSDWVREWRPIYYGSIFTPAALRDLGTPWRVWHGIAKSRHRPVESP